MTERRDGQTYYEVLEIKNTAGPTDIYEAYQRARSTYSPNSPALYSMFTADEAAQLMSLIEEAYQTLSHQGRRRDYDVKIGIAQPLPAARQPAPPPPMVAKSPSATKTGAAETWIGPVRVTSKAPDLAPGFGRTKFSVYEVDPAMEQYIEAMTDCEGGFLQKVRLYKGVTLDQMSDEIRVIKSTLAALEANELNALPVAVFTRGFVVQFARTLGLNDRRVSDAYMKYFRSKRPT
jgi:hypothetical protein